MGLVQTVLSRKWSRVNIAILYILIAVLASAAGQVLLKKGMASTGVVTLSVNQLGSILWRIGTNPYVVIGLIVYVCGTIFWLAALSRVDLSYAYPFASLSYLVMLAASWLLFSEDITLARLLGTMVVGLGVLLISQS
jgi:drug/metabolite transporter (DMT)-like permease